MRNQYLFCVPFWIQLPYKSPQLTINFVSRDFYIDSDRYLIKTFLNDCL